MNFRQGDEILKLAAIADAAFNLNVQWIVLFQLSGAQALFVPKTTTSSGGPE